MFERPQSGERSLIIQVSSDSLLSQPEQQEFIELALSAGAEVVDSIHTLRKFPEPRYFIGKGKAEELQKRIADNRVELVLFNAALSPSQERNLEVLFRCRVLDRTGLILDIFAQRARSYEGKLQVELAQFRHLSTRLVRGWTHLERQKGGIGLRGPGETQLETDRRLLSERIKQITRRLDKVSTQRQLLRYSRKRKGYPVVAIVGYTNAGKSTLFNALTDAKVYARNQLFATLDPTLRKLKSEYHDEVMLTDTVGFVSDLPHELVAAFKSTLQETIEADLLLHVIDSADAAHIERESNVLDILKSIGADTVPTIRVYNKIDLTEQSAQVIHQQGRVQALFVSAHSGQGMGLLSRAVQSFFYGEVIELVLKIAPQSAKLRAKLFEQKVVIDECYDDEGYCILSIRLSTARCQQLQRAFANDWHVVDASEPKYQQSIDFEPIDNRLA